MIELPFREKKLTFLICDSSHEIVAMQCTVVLDGSLSKPGPSKPGTGHLKMIGRSIRHAVATVQWAYIHVRTL